MNYLLKALTTEANPVGNAHSVASVESYLVSLADSWDNEVVGPPKAWYEYLMFWKWGTKVNLETVTRFLIGALDELIKRVEEELDLGPDKKATVLDAIGRLYDYVIAEAMPVWLQPFAGVIKNYIINTLISTAIDWIVDQYNNGSWRMAEEE